MTDNRLLKKYVDSNWAKFDLEGKGALTLDTARSCIQKILKEIGKIG